jgi:hypothetical protein
LILQWKPDNTRPPHCGSRHLPLPLRTVPSQFLSFQSQRTPTTTDCGSGIGIGHDYESWIAAVRSIEIANATAIATGAAMQRLCLIREPRLRTSRDSPGAPSSIATQAQVWQLPISAFSSWAVLREQPCGCRISLSRGSVPDCPLCSRTWRSAPPGC